MNFLAIDYGTKRIGLATAVNGVISPISPVKNDNSLIDNLKKIIKEYQIDKIYVGISEGVFAQKTKKFVEKLELMVKLDIELVEEAVSTIEADEIYKENKKPKKKYKSLIDSVSAAVILRRAI